MEKKVRLKKDDFVVVITGASKGEKGKILAVDRKKGRVIVEKVNVKKKHVRPDQNNPQGGIIEIEGPIQASNVMLYSQKLKSVTKPVYKKMGDKRVRVCKKSGEELLSRDSK